MRFNSIPASVDDQDIPARNWKDISDADREARMVANAIVEFAARPKLPLEVFHTSKARTAWRKLQACASEEVIPLSIREEFEHLADPTALQSDIANLVGKFIARNGIKAGDHLVSFLAESERANGNLLPRLLAAEIDVSNPPPADKAIFYVTNKLTGTAGNMGAIIGKAKSYKSVVIEAHAAACMQAEGLGTLGADTLGISAEPPRGKAVVVIDTEQSPADACFRVNRSLRRIGLTPTERPAWLRTFAFAGWRAQELTAGLPQLLEQLAADHGGIHAVFIDGGADFAVNVNDPEAAADLCAGWHALAIRHCCHILIVIHSNEGEKSDDTARGWLGKQLRRKAESNLQLKRDGDVVTLFAENGQRRAPILEAHGPRFKWSEEAGMPMSIESADSVRADARVSKLKELADDVFDEGVALTYGEARDAIVRIRSCSSRWAEKQIDAMKSARVLRVAGGGKYIKA